MVRTNHGLSRTLTGWLRERFATSESDAEATCRILFALGASQALLDDDQFSARPLSDADLADALGDSCGTRMGDAIVP